MSCFIEFCGLISEDKNVDWQTDLRRKSENFVKIKNSVFAKEFFWNKFLVLYIFEACIEIFTKTRLFVKSIFFLIFKII